MPSFGCLGLVIPVERTSGYRFQVKHKDDSDVIWYFSSLRNHSPHCFLEFLFVGLGLGLFGPLSF